MSVVTSAASQIAPPSWAGMVVLGESALVTTPTDREAEVLRRILAGIPTGSLTSSEAVPAVLR
ncbi:hypothetical protein [Streptomyces aquilus]|uniref:hypothetical protein n=1 Tax=Streptomyces aquilus TaxID=2548456 RepID=UPI0031344403